ncbi:MAG: aminotransferase class V-fold PLP-dependent enzyme [Erysipelotrichaceae bacterium]|nr:aminotransferase class V-fold PLP-dependent enzyme [Erysipelotrichaceae bacterium]
MKIYLDAVSTTAPDPEVRDTYEKLLDQYYCNSDALYDDGVAIYDMQEKARHIICDLFGIGKDELIFTSGASEANSLAIKGLCFAHPERKHLITSIYEHSSVYNAMKQMEESFGYEVTYLDPDENGNITPAQVRENLRDDTLLVSVMAVNNEIGAINDVAQMASIVKKHRGAYFHTDITQAVGKIPVDLKDVDLASFSAHKIHGLKGSGGLIRKQHVELLPLISGGQQEFSLRGGTSNALVNIVLAKTLRLALENEKRYDTYLKETKPLVDYYKDKLVKIYNNDTLESLYDNLDKEMR